MKLHILDEEQKNYLECHDSKQNSLIETICKHHIQRTTLNVKRNIFDLVLIFQTL